jgi:catechol 2,3-dioxygenase-like lactoylglutathione lyase family enzyme
MIRVSSLEDSVAFFEVLGLLEIRRRADEKGRYTNVFLAARPNEAAPLELTYNWRPEPYTADRNSGHLAYAVDKVYDTCNAFIARGAVRHVTAAWPSSARRTASPSSCCRRAARCRQPNAGPACPTPVPGRAGSLWRVDRFALRDL